MDAEVAERVMGATIAWFVAEGVRDPIWLDRDDGRVPHYSTDSAADYTVLEHVRETWGAIERELFRFALLTLYGGRWDADEAAPRHGEPLTLHLRYHRVGDYSRAALAALNEEGTP